MFLQHAVLCFIIICAFRVTNAARHRPLSSTTLKSYHQNDVIANIRTSLRDCPLYEYKFGDVGEVSPAGGSPTYSKEFAHMTAIGWSSASGKIDWLCGGSLISEIIVLSAAHCASLDNVRPDIARMGDIDLYSSEDDEFAQQRKIVKIIRHPQHRFSSKYFDIALMHLDEKISITPAVCPACLWTSNTIQFPILEAAGWGRIGHSEKQTPKLLKVSLKPITTEKCKTIYEPSKSIKKGLLEHQICAGDPVMDTCPGDSGGPLQIKLLSNYRLTPFIIGITSYGAACGFDTPGVYTNVASFTNWIVSETNITTDPLKCTLRYNVQREYEPAIIMGRYPGGLVTLDKTEGTIQPEKFFSDRASLGFMAETKYFQALCSGTIIASKFVLSLASCVKNNIKALKTVQMGNIVRYWLPPDVFPADIQYIDIAKVVFHPDNADIVLIKLSNDIRRTESVAVACLWPETMIPVKELDGIGIGPLNSNVFLSSAEDVYFNNTQLNSLDLKLMLLDDKECSNVNSRAQFCAGTKPYFTVPGACELDTGNSIERKIYYRDRHFPFTFGINPFDKNCGFGKSAKFTRVSAFIDWIDSVVFDEENTSSRIDDSKAPQRDEDTSSNIHYIEEDVYELGDACTSVRFNDSICVAAESCPQLLRSFREKKQQIHFCSVTRGAQICCPHKFIFEPSSNRQPVQRVSAASTCSDKYQQYRIGDSTAHLAVIGRENSNAFIPHCVGILISELHILASAECLSSNSEINTVHFRDNQTLTIAAISIHPEYTPELNTHDLAVVQLSSPVRIRQDVVPSCLWYNTTHTPVTLYAQGVKFTDNSVSNHERLPLINQECKKLYPNISEHQICADSVRLKANTCFNGDHHFLAAYYIQNNFFIPYVVGISPNVENCEKSTPIIYTRISSYVEWIAGIIEA